MPHSDGQEGFTLVEVMTAGIIATVLAGSILSAMYMVSTTLKSGSEVIRASQKAALVSWQFRDWARKAYAVKGNLEELPSGAPDTTLLTNRIVSHFLFMGPPPTFDTLGGFRVYSTNNRLDEFRKRNGLWGWHPIVIGDKDTVSVRSYTVSFFTLLPLRRGVELQTAYRYSTAAYLASQTDRALCRNQNR